MYQRSRLYYFYLVFFSVYFFIIGYIFIISFSNQPGQFGYQAQSFLHGKLDIPSGIDTVSFKGKYYWHQNPLPAILLIPGQLFIGETFNESVAQPIVVLLLTFILYKLARIRGVTSYTSYWLIFMFLFGSVMINFILRTQSYFYSQILATTFLAGFLLEYETKKRHWVLGILEALLVATRPTASLIGLLIVGELVIKYFRSKNSKPIIYQLIKFLLPIFLVMAFLLWFNYMRFDNPFFNAYKASNINIQLKPLLDLGLFSFKHIPSNIYYYFLISFIPIEQNKHLVFPYLTFSPWGLSFFIVCPFFIYAFKTLRDSAWPVLGYWSIILITLFVLLTYYGGAGYTTFGPRYTADFLPILYLLLLYYFKNAKFGNKEKLIIIVSSFLNLYLLKIYLLTPYSF